MFWGRTGFVHEKSLPWRHPILVVIGTAILMDLCVEATLVYYALEAGIRDVWIFFVLVVFQAIFAWIVGIMTDLIRKKELVLASIMLEMGLIMLVAWGDFK